MTYVASTSSNKGHMMTSAKVGIGIDVAKNKVDVASSDGTWTTVFKTNKEELAALVRECVARAPYRVVLEASGGYERPVLLALHAAQLPVVMVHPRRARAFATALNIRAKTDRIDAMVLAEMALVETREPRFHRTRWTDEAAYASRSISGR